MNCSYCQFFEEEEGNLYHGECHRHAPTPFIVKRVGEEEFFSGFPENWQINWPVVSFSEWCGEWKKKEE